MRFSLATKVFLAFTIVIVTFLLVLVFGIIRTQETYSQVRIINQVIVPLSFQLADIQSDLKAFKLILSENDPIVLKRTMQVTRLSSTLPSRFSSKIEKSVSLFSAEGHTLNIDRVKKEIIELQNTVSKFTTHSEKFGVLIFEDENENEIEKDSIEMQRQVLIELTTDIDKRLSVLQRRLRTITNQGLEQTKKQERSSLYALVSATGIALFIAILLILMIGKNLRPLVTLTDATKRIADGEYALIKTEKLGSSEIATLGKEFNSMVHALKERDEELHVQHQKLLKSERLATVGRMTSVITHELRNPLSSINLNSEMLRDIVSQSENSDAVPILELIISEVDRLREITDNYLGYAKTNKATLIQTNLSEVIRKLIDFHEWEWTELGVGIDLKIDNELSVLGDKNQLRQAFLNLVKNAVEASDKGEQVFIFSKQTKHAISIHIVDQGAGIPLAKLKDLFEPFVTTKTKGTGLGLAITQQIVEEHVGNIRVNTSMEGTEFIVSLPKFKG